MVFVNQSFPNRPADDTAGDETEGSGGDGNGDAAVKADVFQQGTEGRCRAVTADHGNRSRCQSHERTEVEDCREAHPDDILEGDENRRDDGHFKDHDAASFDEADAGRVADTGEKEHHTDVLHNRILLVLPKTLSIENAVDDSE